MWANWKKKIWAWRGVLITAPSIALVVIALRYAGWLQPLEWAALDRFFLQRGSESTESPIVIVGINEEDITKTAGGWPISDALLAQLLQKIKQQQPTAVGLDLVRDLPVGSGHQELVKVFKTTPNLVGIEKAPNLDSKNKAEEENSAIAAPPALKEKGQVAAADVVLDPDGKIRRALLFLETQNGETLDTLGLRLALMYLEGKNITPQTAPDGINMQLGNTVFRRFQANDGGYMRADANGYQILFNFKGSSGSFKTISMTDVLQNRIPSNLLRGRVVLIGPTAASLKDRFYTPYSGHLIDALELTPGVEIHANLTNQIISSVVSDRPLIKTWQEPYEWLWIFAWSSLGALLSWTGRYSSGIAKFSPSVAASMILAGGSLIVGSYLAFLQGWWIPAVPAIIALAGSATAVTAYIARTARDIRKTFGRYLTDQVVANLLETPEGLKLGGERRQVTILMSDLRGFSAVSERMPPETVVAFLNIYLGDMAEVISKYNGTIDEFIGDAILVIFGAPTQREDDAERAIACAIDMQLSMDAVNEQIKSLGMPKLEMGIGINTGEVVVGNIGSQKRAKYGIVGSHVNLTGRIESYTVGGQILVSEYTFKEVKSNLRIDGEMIVEPKGIKQPITLYDIGGIEGRYNLLLPAQEDNYCTLASALPLHYTVLDGKHVVGTLFKGSIVKLSPNGAHMIAENSLDPLSNLKINLSTSPQNGNSSGDLYAKVVGSSKDGDAHCCIRFTAVPPDVSAILSALLKDNHTQLQP